MSLSDSCKWVITYHSYHTYHNSDLDSLVDEPGHEVGHIVLVQVNGYQLVSAGIASKDVDAAISNATIKEGHTDIEHVAAVLEAKREVAVSSQRHCQLLAVREVWLTLVDGQVAVVLLTPNLTSHTPVLLLGEPTGVKCFNARPGPLRLLKLGSRGWIPC